MNIKEEMDVEDGYLLDTTNGDFLNEAQYDAFDIKLEEDPADLSEALTQNGPTYDIKQEIDIEPTTLLVDTTNENQYSNIKFEESLPEEQELKCNICNLKFKYKSTLKRHLSSHTNDRPSKCDTCQATYKRKCHLHREARHSSKKAFKCDICQGQFKLKEELLTLHSVTHSNKYDFECDICHGKFKRKGDLLNDTFK